MFEEISISTAGVIDLFRDQETLMQSEVDNLPAKALLDKNTAIEWLTGIGKLEIPVVGWHECQFDILENGDPDHDVKFVGHFACSLNDPDHILQIVSCPDEIEAQDAFHPLSWRMGRLVIYYSLAAQTKEDARKEFENVISAYRKNVDHLCHLTRLYTAALPYLATKIVELKISAGAPPRDNGRVWH